MNFQLQCMTLALNSFAIVRVYHIHDNKNIVHVPLKLHLNLTPTHCQTVDAVPCCTHNPPFSALVRGAQKLGEQSSEADKIC